MERKTLLRDSFPEVAVRFLDGNMLGRWLFPSPAEPPIIDTYSLIGAKSVQAGTQKALFAFWGGGLDDRVPISIFTELMGGVVGEGCADKSCSPVVGPEFFAFQDAVRELTTSYGE